MSYSPDRYIALIEEAASDSFGVVFPDFPGCIAHGSSLDGAIMQGSEALSLHIRGMQEDGEAIPAPRSLATIRASREDWYDANLPAVYITALPPKSASERVNVTLERDLLKAIDGAATREGMNRSAWLAQAARTLLRA